MRQLKEVHPEYADRLGFLAVNVDPSESVAKILAYKESMTKSPGYTWDMTSADRDMLRSYNVTRQAAYATIDANGVVVSSVTYGSESADSWRELFDSLLNS